MGFLKKVLKAGNPLKATKKTLKTGNKLRKKGNKLTKSALGGGKGKHKKAGLRSGGKRAAARNARAKAAPVMKAGRTKNARSAYRSHK